MQKLSIFVLAFTFRAVAANAGPVTEAIESTAAALLRKTERTAIPVSEQAIKDLAHAAVRRGESRLPVAGASARSADAAKRVFENRIALDAKPAAAPIRTDGIRRFVPAHDPKVPAASGWLARTAEYGRQSIGLAWKHRGTLAIGFVLTALVTAPQACLDIAGKGVIAALSSSAEYLQAVAAWCISRHGWLLASGGVCLAVCWFGWKWRRCLCLAVVRGGLLPRQPVNR